MENNENKFDPGEQVHFDVKNYGSGKGFVSGIYKHSDGTIFYAVYPKTIRKNSGYKYLCLIVPENELVSAPF